MPLPSKDQIELALEKETNKGILELNSSKISQEKNDILQSPIFHRVSRGKTGLAAGNIMFFQIN